MGPLVGQGVRGASVLDWQGGPTDYPPLLHLVAPSPLLCRTLPRPDPATRLALPPLPPILPALQVPFVYAAELVKAGLLKDQDARRLLRPLLALAASSAECDNLEEAPYCQLQWELLLVREEASLSGQRAGALGCTDRTGWPVGFKGSLHPPSKGAAAPGSPPHSPLCPHPALPPPASPCPRLPLPQHLLTKDSLRPWSHECGTVDVLERALHPSSPAPPLDVARSLLANVLLSALQRLDLDDFSVLSPRTREVKVRKLRNLKGGGRQAVAAARLSLSRQRACFWAGAACRPTACLARSSPPHPLPPSPGCCRPSS